MATASVVRVRWEKLFDDLEAELEAAEVAQRHAEAAERSQIELGEVRLVDRLAACQGLVQLDVLGAGRLRGDVAAVGDGWLLLQGPPYALVSVAAVLAVEGLHRAARVPAECTVSRQLSFAFALRRLARDRTPVQVTLLDGRAVVGTVDVVAADHLDLAEHAADEPRRAGAVTRVRSLPFVALAVLTPIGPTTLG